MAAGQSRSTGNGAVLGLGEESRAVLSQPMFFTFGMFIIDEIEHLSIPQPPKYNLLGGAGLYALLGARLLCPPPYSKHCSWILDAGSDFPASIAAQIKSWQTSTRIRYDLSRLTTRAWNGYGGPNTSHQKSKEGEGHRDQTLNIDVDSEYRAFKYLTPKLRLDVEDLDDAQVTGRSWHMVCSPSRCAEIVRKLESRRNEVGYIQETVVIWEPIPDLCTPAELMALRSAARGVDIISPNAAELRAFFEDIEGGEVGQDELVARLMGWDLIENKFEAVKASEGGEHISGTDGAGENIITNVNSTTKSVMSTRKQTSCIVREGKFGSTIYFHPSIIHANMPTKNKTLQEIRKLHLPAYHTKSMSPQVLDPTGGGNTYLGALALTLAYTTKPTSASTNLNSSGMRTRNMPPAIKAISEFVNTLFPSPRRLESTSQAAPVSASEAQPYPPQNNHRIQTQISSLLTASIAACIAASYAIEQNGVPQLSAIAGEKSTVDSDIYFPSGGWMEVWNDSSVLSRVQAYLDREGDFIREEIGRLLGQV